MTTVNVTTQNNTVSVSSAGNTTVVETPKTNVVTAITAGPQGASGSDFSINGTAKIDRSVVYYDSASGEYKADATWTIDTIVLGGNF